MFRAKCDYCDFKGTIEHEFLGHAKFELYRHFDASPVCADKFEADQGKGT